ncbi:MAG: RdgB/HAM1 family non-canonical purine NTP pyrophosphatase [Saprospiraceae bacterium]|nr:RdgB/HAM1 family non-canonical purine NTP pyrophosphatase [Saprospiraceae bacterium]
MNKDETLLFATANEHKLTELRKIFSDSGFRIAGLKELDIHEEIPETGATLQENAFIKAKYLFDKTGLRSLSEDTGLEVSALDGAPGVHTARYAGNERDPSKNIQKLLLELKNKDDRSARFRTVIALYDGLDCKYFQGIAKGKIAVETSGDGGFGYDPIFIPEGYDQTFAELSSEVKNKISHRAKAVEFLKAYLAI